MISQAAHSSLSDALEALRATSKDALQWPSFALQGTDHLLRKLVEAINGIELKPSSRPTPRLDYVEQWRDLQDGRRKELTSRALRYLCWEPEIATSRPFKTHLQRTGTPLTARFIQGLVYSCHERWSQDFAKGATAVWVLGAIQEYEGANRLLKRWKIFAEMILGAHGHVAFARLLVKEEAQISLFCETWGVDEKSAYTRESIQFASAYCRDQAKLSQYLLEELLPWHQWPLEAFKSEISKTILSATERGPNFVEALKRFVRGDERLLDPRLPKNAKNWTGISEKARLLFIQWLSRADIEFFFQHVLPRGHDPHGRKKFWLQYVNRVYASRPLLNHDDERRLQPWLSQNRVEVGLYGRIDETTSAFLLDFGSVLVVEFSQSGNACYVYDRQDVSQVVPDFWTVRWFGFGGLKQRPLSLARISHFTGWEERMQDTLAQHGIRPEGRL